MTTYRFTFGSRYRREPHPVLGHTEPRLPDGWLEVTAPNEFMARRIIFEHVGDRRCFCYPERRWDHVTERFYPAGRLATVTPEGIEWRADVTFPAAEGSDR